MLQSTICEPCVINLMPGFHPVQRTQCKNVFSAYVFVSLASFESLTTVACFPAIIAFVAYLLVYVS